MRNMTYKLNHGSSAIENTSIGMIEMSLGLMDTCKRRDKQVIIAEITKIARNGALKTQIMYRAKLCFSQVNEYLELLQKFDFLEKSAENGKEVYRATPKGLEYLLRQQELQQMLYIDVRIGMKIPPQSLI